MDGVGAVSKHDFASAVALAVLPQPEVEVSDTERYSVTQFDTCTCRFQSLVLGVRPTFHPPLNLSPNVSVKILLSLTL